LLAEARLNIAALELDLLPADFIQHRSTANIEVTERHGRDVIAGRGESGRENPLFVGRT